MEKGKEKKVDMRNGVEYCIHNMPKETCSFCSGDYDKGKQEEKSRKECRVKDSEELRLQSVYDMKKAGFSRFGDLWEEDEVSQVKSIFEGVSRKSKMFRKLVLQTSLELERTKNAIIWMYKWLFQPKIPYHRSKLVLEYMK